MMCVGTPVCHALKLAARTWVTRTCGSKCRTNTVTHVTHICGSWFSCGWQYNKVCFELEGLANLTWKRRFGMRAGETRTQPQRARPGPTAKLTGLGQDSSGARVRQT